MKANSPFFIKPLTLLITGAVESKFLTLNLNTHFEFLESQLASSPNNGEYLCGSALTGADIVMSYPLGAARGRVGLTKEKFPKLCGYVDRLEARDAFKIAVQKIVDIESSYTATP